MLLLDGRLDELRSELDGVRAAQWRRLYEQCEWYRRQQPPAEHPTASITYFGPAAANLALAHRLTGQAGYLAEAWRWIDTAISYPHWGKAHLPDHDLDAGWLLHGLALAYSWLHDDLDSDRRAVLRDKLILQGQRLYEYAVETEGRWWSSSYWQNHNWICYAGLATAGYALGRGEWTERAKADFADVVDLLPADGSDSEGVVYWRYGVPWLAMYLDVLRDAEEIDWWERCQFLANTFTWRLHQCAPGFEENVDHGDCHDRRSGHSVALYYKLAAEYRLGTAQWLANLVAHRFFWREAYESGVRPGVLPEAYLELLWYEPSVVPRHPADTVERAAYFPDLGQVCARTGWHDAATLVSFKASPGGGHTAWDTSRLHRRERGWDTLNAGHHHPDAGSFVLHSHGAFLAVDDGYCNRKLTSHHNLVLVDGQGYEGDGRYHVYKELPDERRAQLRDIHIADGWAHAVAENAAMYPPSLTVRRADRTLVLTPSGRLVLLDRLESDEPREWTLLLHSDWPAQHVDGAWRMRSGPAQAWVRCHADGDVRAEQGETHVEANPTSSTPSLVINKTLHTLRHRTSRRTSAQFLTVVEPTSALHPSRPVARCVSTDLTFGVDFDDGEQVLFDRVGAWRAEGTGT